MDETATSDSSQNGAPWRDRRRFLGTIAAFSAVPMTGCLGGGGDSGGEPDNGASDSATQQSSCPSLPLSYKEYQVTESPAVAFEVPAETSVTSDDTGSDSTTSFFNSAALVDDSRTPLTYQIDVEGWDTPIDEIDMEADRYDEDVTSEYDLAASDARVIKFPTEGREDRWMFLEHPDGPVRILIAPGDVDDDGICTDAAVAVRQRVIETMRPLE